jgi:ferredoxin
MPHSCASDTPAAAPSRLAPRPSRAGRWRALVLVLVHVAIALHVWHWHATGSTLSPLEPSESMAFSQRGIVNAGLLFFGLAILSTLVLGRWFCGWACHLVALQDGARWLLGRFGIRPRPVQLGLIGAVPWLAFAYMFLSPLLLRLLEGTGLAPAGTELVTEQFWKTFPPWPIAVLSLLVCSAAIVWVLGSKGFCTYGCPYGAIFGISDQFAPLRIRVTDDCEHCGHCTTACSSNVNVSQEVREWGMVVDPGCMKCGDCVSVCPKDALYVGWGAPALLARRREEPRRAARRDWSRELLLLGFLFGTFLLLHAYDSRYGVYSLHLDATLWTLIGVLSAGSFAVALLLRGKARRVQETSLAEELLLAATFLAALYAFRGLGGSTPLLMTLALAAMLALLSLYTLRLVRSPELAWKNWRLRRAGRLTLAGGVFALVALALGAGTAAAAWTQRESSAEWSARRAQAQQTMAEGTRPALERALELDPQLVAARKLLAGKLYEAGELHACLEQCRICLSSTPRDPELHVLAALSAAGLGDLALARGHVEQALALHPGLPVAQQLLEELRKP